jgi:ribosomal-protein-alanine N-acetyltransferase
MSYKLVSLSPEIIPILYEWDKVEPNRKLFTCRQVHDLPSPDEYSANLLTKIQQAILKIYILVSEEDSDKPLGRVLLFDFNHRNKSAEFGYYIPPIFRGQGHGQMMIRLLLEEAFDVHNMEINKLYATTSSSNARSVRLLEKLNFHLDGRLREHYWIGEERHDQLHFSMLRYDYCSILRSGQSKNFY